MHLRFVDNTDYEVKQQIILILIPHKGLFLPRDPKTSNPSSSWAQVEE